MASKIKVDEITTVSETGDVTIPGGVGLDGSQSTACWKLPKGTESQRPTGGGGEIRFNTDSNNLEFHNGTEFVGVKQDLGLDGSSPAKASTSAQMHQCTSANFALATMQALDWCQFGAWQAEFFL